MNKDDLRIEEIGKKAEVMQRHTLMLMTIAGAAIREPDTTDPAFINQLTDELVINFAEFISSVNDFKVALEEIVKEPKKPKEPEWPV